MVLAFTAVFVQAAGVGAQGSADGPFTPRWSVTLPALPSAPAAFDAERAYVPLDDGTVTAIALEDGSHAWTTPASTTLAPAAGNTLVFLADDTSVRALYAEDGRERWRITVNQSVAMAPLFDTGWLFVGTQSGQMFALRAADGAILWTIDAGAPLAALPAPAGTRVYLPLADGHIVASDLYTGDVLWTRMLTPPLSEILALDDRMFVGSGDNYLYCLTLKDGADRWSWRTGGDIVGAPVVDERRVFFMSLDNTLRALDRGSGSQRWNQPLSSRTVGGPLRSESYVLMATLASQLRAYSRADGQFAGSSPEPTGDALSSTLIAPPQLVTLHGRDAFLLLTEQGFLQLFTYPDLEEESDDQESEDDDESQQPSGVQDGGSPDGATPLGAFEDGLPPNGPDGNVRGATESP